MSRSTHNYIVKLLKLGGPKHSDALINLMGPPWPLAGALVEFSPCVGARRQIGSVLSTLYDSNNKKIYVNIRRDDGKCWANVNIQRVATINGLSTRRAL